MGGPIQVPHRVRWSRYPGECIHLPRDQAERLTLHNGDFWRDDGCMKLVCLLAGRLSRGLLRSGSCMVDLPDSCDRLGRA